MAMQTALKMPLSALNPTVVLDLQERYPEAEMHIVMADMPDAATSMNEEQFWDIISLLDWSKEGNDDAVIELSVRELCTLPESSILSFYDLLSEKLYLLDGRDNAVNSVPDNESISSDLFLYARCAVIANGRIFYEAVLKSPMLFQKIYSLKPCWTSRNVPGFEKQEPNLNTSQNISSRQVLTLMVGERIPFHCSTACANTATLYKMKIRTICMKSEMKLKKTCSSLVSQMTRLKGTGFQNGFVPSLIF